MSEGAKVNGINSLQVFRSDDERRTCGGCQEEIAEGEFYLFGIASEGGGEYGSLCGECLVAAFFAIKGEVHKAILEAGIYSQQHELRDQTIINYITTRSVWKKREVR